MELSSNREATSCAATKEIPSILWNVEVHYRVNKGPQMVSVLKKNNTIYNTPSYLSKIHLKIIQSATSWSFQWLFTYYLPNNNLYVFLFFQFANKLLSSST
jgi:hypothetical protein